MVENGGRWLKMVGKVERERKVKVEIKIEIEVRRRKFRGLEVERLRLSLIGGVVHLPKADKSREEKL